jgi:hypothetical protein
MPAAGRGDDNDPLYRSALAAEQDRALSDEMTEWEGALTGDGLADLPAFRLPG